MPWRSADAGVQVRGRSPRATRDSCPDAVGGLYVQMTNGRCGSALAISGDQAEEKLRRPKMANAAVGRGWWVYQGRGGQRSPIV